MRTRATGWPCAPLRCVWSRSSRSWKGPVPQRRPGNARRVAETPADKRGWFLVAEILVAYRFNEPYSGWKGRKEEEWWLRKESWR